MEVKEIYMIIQLADHSTKLPHGVVENMLVDVGKFTLPVEFIIMDIEEGSDIHLILGRPFMNMANVIISVAEGKFTIWVGEEELTFDIFFGLCSTWRTNEHVSK